jgi:hypothetical protein
MKLHERARPAGSSGCIVFYDRHKTRPEPPEQPDDIPGTDATIFINQLNANNSVCGSTTIPSGDRCKAPERIDMQVLYDEPLVPPTFNWEDETTTNPQNPERWDDVPEDTWPEYSS